MTRKDPRNEVDRINNGFSHRQVREPNIIADNATKLDTKKWLKA